MKSSSIPWWAAVVLAIMVLAALGSATAGADPLLLGQAQGVRGVLKHPGSLQVLLRMGAVIFGHPVVAVGAIIICGLKLSKVTDAAGQELWLAPPAVAGAALSYNIWNFPFKTRTINRIWPFPSETVEEFSAVLLIPMVFCALLCAFISIGISKAILAART